MSTGPTPRDQRWLRRTVPLSPLPAERALQWWVIMLAAWFVLCGIATTLTRDADTTGFDQHWPARLAAGVVAVVISGWVHVLVSRHREAIATVHGLKGQFEKVGLAGLVIGVVGLAPWWWAGPVVALVSTTAWVRVRAVQTVPPAEMVEHADYHSAHHWESRSRLAHRPVLETLVIIGVGLVAALVLLGALLLGSSLLS